MTGYFTRSTSANPATGKPLGLCFVDQNDAHFFWSYTGNALTGAWRKFPWTPFGSDRIELNPRGGTAEEYEYSVRAIARVGFRQLFVSLLLLSSDLIKIRKFNNGND